MSPKLKREAKTTPSRTGGDGDEEAGDLRGSALARCESDSMGARTLVLTRRWVRDRCEVIAIFGKNQLTVWMVRMMPDIEGQASKHFSTPTRTGEDEDEAAGDLLERVLV